MLIFCWQKVLKKANIVAAKSDLLEDQCMQQNRAQRHGWC